MSEYLIKFRSGRTMHVRGNTRAEAIALAKSRSRSDESLDYAELTGGELTRIKRETQEKRMSGGTCMAHSPRNDSMCLRPKGHEGNHASKGNSWQQ